MEIEWQTGGKQVAKGWRFGGKRGGNWVEIEWQKGGEYGKFHKFLQISQ